MSTALPLPRFGAGKGLKAPLLDFLETLATMVGKVLRSLIDLGLQMAANCENSETKSTDTNASDMMQQKGHDKNKSTKKQFV